MIPRYLGVCLFIGVGYDEVDGPINNMYGKQTSERQRGLSHVRKDSRETSKTPISQPGGHGIIACVFLFPSSLVVPLYKVFNLYGGSHPRKTLSPHALAKGAANASKPSHLSLHLSFHVPCVSSPRSHRAPAAGARVFFSFFLPARLYPLRSSPSLLPFLLRLRLPFCRRLIRLGFSF